MNELQTFDELPIPIQAIYMDAVLVDDKYPGVLSIHIPKQLGEKFHTFILYAYDAIQDISYVESIRNGGYEKEEAADTKDARDFINCLVHLLELPQKHPMSSDPFGFPFMEEATRLLGGAS